MSRYVTILRSRGAAVIPLDGHDLERAAAAVSGWCYDRATRTLHAPGDDQDGLRVWLTEGQLWTMDPDDAALARLIALAGALGARVRGDDGATYRTPYDTYRHPDDAAAAPRAAPPPPPPRPPSARKRPGPAIPYRMIFWTALLTALALQVVRPFR